VVLWSSG